MSYHISPTKILNFLLSASVWRKKLLTLHKNCDDGVNPQSNAIVVHNNKRN